MPAPAIDTRVTVYSKAGCIPCRGTIRALDKAGIAHEVLKVDEDPAALEQLRAEGYLATPVVVVEHADGTRESWSEHRITRIEALAERVGSQISA